MAPHVLYEWDMLHATAREQPELPDALRNALLESFLVHARQLVDFFCGSGMAKDDDYFATDYAPAWSNPPVTGLLDEARNAVNKYVGHLTGARLVRRDRDVRAILEALRELAARFRLAAEPDLFPELTRLDSVVHASVSPMGVTNTCGGPTISVFRSAK